MRRTLTLVLVLTLVLAGCTEGGDGRGDGKPSRKPAVDEKRPPTVRGMPTDAGTHKIKIDVGTVGHREFLLHVPPKLTRGKWRDGRPAKALPLVVAMHGGLANMRRMESLSGFSPLADDEGFLVAYPDGFATTWNAGDCCGVAKIGRIDDVGFLTKLINKVTDAGLADPDRVYATGFSNGAGMAYRLACEGPGKLAAIGVVEGALVTSCEPSRPVSAMIFHGTADRSVPYGGGGHRDFNDRRPFPSVSYAVDFWRKEGRLPALRNTTLNQGETTCRSTGKGDGGAEVTFCRIDGGTHRWPDGAARMLWDFFAAHPRE